MAKLGVNSAENLLGGTVGGVRGYVRPVQLSSDLWRMVSSEQLSRQRKKMKWSSSDKSGKGG